MSDRRLTVDAAFGFGPFDTVTAGDWVPLTDGQGQRVRAVSWSIGRDDELGHFPAGTATVLLRNRDRALDPDNSTSPHAGALLPLVPVRVRSQDVDTLAYTDEFYGFVRDGWRQVLAPKGTSDCEIELVDLLGVIAGYQLPDVFDHEILSQGPRGYWVLDEGKAESVDDLSGNGNEGTVVGSVTFGQPPVAPGHSPSALFEAGTETFGRVELSRSPIITSSNVSVVATFKVRNASNALNWRTLFIHDTGNGGSNQKGFQVDVDTTGEPHFARRSSFGDVAYQPAVNVADGRGHVLFAVVGLGVGIDSATLVSTSGTLVLGSANGVGIGGFAGIKLTDHWDGWIGAVAVYSHILFPADCQAILDAADRLNGFRSDQQIGWALDRVGVPAGLRNLDVGTVIMGPAATKGQDALAFVRLVAATEGGGLYVDHRDGGKLRFTNRYHRFLATRSTGSQATFADDQGTPHIRYAAEGLDVASNGLDGIVNQATVRWADGEVTVPDATSIAAYGPRPHTVETVATTAGQARSVGEWLVARYKDPRPRVRGVTVSAKATRDRDDRAGGLRVDDRVTFRVQPAKTGAVTEVDLFVDGVRHVAQGVEWVTAFRFAPVDTFTPWVWGTGAWGTTAFWG